MRVKYLRGVNGVINEIQLQSTPTVFDVREQISQELQRTVNDDVNDIDVETSNGHVILRGTVQSWAEDEAARRASWSVPGVTSRIAWSSDSPDSGKVDELRRRHRPLVGRLRVVGGDGLGGLLNSAGLQVNRSSITAALAPAQMGAMLPLRAALDLPAITGLVEPAEVLAPVQGEFRPGRSSARRRWPRNSMPPMRIIIKTPKIPKPEAKLRIR